METGYEDNINAFQCKQHNKIIQEQQTAPKSINVNGFAYT
jgi:hypothetical protein